MDPLSSFVTGHVAGKLIDYVADKFRIQVLRWSRRRAEHFFDEFCRVVELERSGQESEKLDDCLSRLLDDEASSEVLFDAYRRVCFAKSRSIGPRIIAILTAELLLERRLADEAETAMLTAAENLADDELLAYAEFVHEQLTKAADPTTQDVTFSDDGGLQIEWDKEQLVSTLRHRGHVSLAPLDLRQCLGPWALKMKSYGIISDDVKEHQWEYEADSERYVDEDGSVRELSWWLYLPKPFLRLADLVRRVSQIPDSVI